MYTYMSTYMHTLIHEYKHIVVLFSCKRASIGLYLHTCNRSYMYSLPPQS